MIGDSPFELTGADQLNSQNSFEIDINDSCLFNNLIIDQYGKHFNMPMPNKKDALVKNPNLEDSDEDEAMFKSAHLI